MNKLTVINLTSGPLLVRWNQDNGEKRRGIAAGLVINIEGIPTGERVYFGEDALQEITQPENARIIAVVGDENQFGTVTFDV